MYLCISNASMKRHLHILVSLFVALIATSVVAAPPPYDNPEVYRINKVNPHSQNYPSESSDYHILINNGWRVQRFADAGKAKSFATSGSRIANLRMVSLPAVWPQGDSVTVLAADITLPSSWEGRRTIIKIGAVGPAVHLYVNGTMAGYAEDSYTPSEWDITKLLTAGRNRLTLCIYGKSDANKIEPRNTPVGVTRDVELYSLPPLHIIDYNLFTTVDAEGRGHMDITVDLSGEVKGGHRVEITVTDTSQPVSRPLLQRSITLVPKDWFVSFAEKDNKIGQVVAWSDCRPFLYRLDIRLYSPGGKLLHSVSTPIGFRSLDFDNRVWNLNGKPMQIRGIAWDEPLPRPAPDSLINTLLAIKGHGYNLIRLQRPASELFYSLCDQIGLMVWNCCAIAIDDADRAIGEGEEYEESIIYRAHNIIRRDRSHPCIIAWGIGDGMPWGYCAEQVERFVSARDAARPFLCRAYSASNTLSIRDKKVIDYLSLLGRYPRGRSYLLLLDEPLNPQLHDATWDTIASYPILQGMVCGHWDSLTADQRNAHLRMAHRLTDGTPCAASLIEIDRSVVVKEKPVADDVVPQTQTTPAETPAKRKGLFGWVKSIFGGE